ncbi:MAG TPA: hydantoinase/oxoprolinase family protein, partial [Xanthobacteraceae bacterium]|nr:hydantoinase/oxoprolinase family protein [Xanthobacteraceae bacterium]
MVPEMRIGIDVGGTFTDLVAIDDHGVATLAKVPSTPDDPSRGVLDGLARLADGLAVPTAELLRATNRIVHGTTVATNALLEGKGARTGMLVTAGHRDVIEMREGLKPIERYNMRMPPPPQLVPRALRVPVVERLRHDGRVEIPLDEKSLDRAIAVLSAAEVEAVAVCFLHAWRDANHERIAADAVRRALPNTYVAMSSEVLPKIKEFERFSTTVVNAYVGPRLARYLERLGQRLEGAGYVGPVLIMQSHGGVMPIEEATRLAAGAVLSGPAGGVAGSRHAGKLVGEGNLIPFDMGGTSTDISLIVGGSSSLAMDRAVGGHRVALDSLDIISIGAGGGSIARVDAGGILHVGPESAGAVPGPACYGRGGAAPTITDCNLVLGYLGEDNFLGGRMRLDAAKARAAIETAVATPLGLDVAQAAEGIIRVID